MKKLIIIGAGGLGREVAQYIEDINCTSPTYEVLGFVDSAQDKKGISYAGIQVLGDFDDLGTLLNSNEGLFGFCAIANPKIKKRIVHQMQKYNIKPIRIIHPNAYVSPQVKIGVGTLISPNCVITTNINIGDYVLINPQCGIGHDTMIGEYTTLYWSVNISGNVKVGKEVEIGSKAFVKQGLQVEDNSFIGAGAVVTHSVEKGITVVGVPAKPLQPKAED